jgi:hypothetical protein
MGALAHLQIGAVLTRWQVRPRKGRPRTTTSSRFWKDADPDVPILKEAKAECAKLQ